ncbi:MAG: FHA domain-containing protein [bacterium]|nr:FHA domain-containing protein [bacterium]
MENLNNTPFGRTADGKAMRSRICLKVAEGPSRGLDCTAISDSMLLVGRSQTCDLPVCDPRMSRKHFLAKFSEGHWWICDLGSSNGTRVNDLDVHQPVAAREGDNIVAGDTTFRIWIYEAGAEAAVPQDSSNMIHDYRSPQTENSGVI